MNTVTLEQPGRFILSDTPPPNGPGRGEALVRIRRVGICGTDIHAFIGDQPYFTYPRILGHELGVEVLAVGQDVSNVRIGDRCAIEPYLNCEKCIACRTGKTNCCAELKVLGVHTDGGMRERIVVPADKLHPSVKLSLDQLALVETLGIGAHAVGRAGIEPGEYVLVIGAGPIGLSVVQFASQAGARVIVSDVNENRLAFCREMYGVETVIGGSVERVREMTDGDLPTAVFDATGSPKSMEAAFEYVAPGGRLIFVGLVQADITFSDPHFHKREITLLATRNSTAGDMRRVMALMEGGQIDTAPWITHRAPCTEMIDRFPGWLLPESKTIKAVVQF